MRQRSAKRLAPPEPPAELMRPVWHHLPTFEDRQASWAMWREARRLWLAGYGWTPEELSDDIGMGRPVPAHLMAFYLAGSGGPIDPDSI
jgi:hypothetical protein